MEVVILTLSVSKGKNPAFCLDSLVSTIRSL